MEKKALIKFLYENWFRVGILTLWFVTIASFLYVHAKEQNLAVFNRVESCKTKRCLSFIKEHSIFGAIIAPATLGRPE